MKTKTITFEFEKLTKNTVKFNETAVEGQPTIVGAIYVQKWFIGPVGPGSQLSVTLESSGTLSPVSTQTAVQLLA